MNLKWTLLCSGKFWNIEIKKKIESICQSSIGYLSSVFTFGPNGPCCPDLPAEPYKNTLALLVNPHGPSK